MVLGAQIGFSTASGWDWEGLATSPKSNSQPLRGVPLISLFGKMTKHKIFPSDIYGLPASPWGNWEYPRKLESSLHPLLPKHAAHAPVFVFSNTNAEPVRDSQPWASARSCRLTQSSGCSVPSSAGSLASLVTAGESNFFPGKAKLKKSSLFLCNSVWIWGVRYIV